MNAEQIAELKRLHEAETSGEWAVSKRAYKGDGYKYLEIESICKAYWICKVLWFDPSPVNGEDPQYRANAEFIAALHNAFPALIAALEAAQAERDERTTMAARAQEAMRYLLNGLPATDAIWAAYGNADSARAWLAARDARLKAEGAAEWLECHRNDDWLAVDQRERFDREAAELRREAGE